MFNFFANFFGYFLNYIYSFVNNYGIAIILFSILLKIIMLPISIKQQKTLKKSAQMQVKVKEIQEKYSNDQVKQSQELMDLYKRENMSPFSGCLGSIMQFIIVISMFYLVSSPLTYMKKIDPQIVSNYATQIKEEKGESLRYQEIAIIKEKGNSDENVNLNMNFLGLDLSDVPTEKMNDWKVFVIPVLYVLTSFASMKLTTSMTKAKKEEKKEIKNVAPSNDEKSLVPKEKGNDDQEAMEEMQKQMNMMMPIMTVSIALIAPLGLALYWLVNNLMMIIERIIVNKFFKEGE